ncbi:MAG: hypothetical protein K9K86_00485 [Pseudomonadales bacterium]|nr:hypothetical protein [Pseudomonadales bacterium]
MEFNEIISIGHRRLNFQDSNTSLVRWCLLITLVLLVWVWVFEPLQNWRGALKSQVSQNAEKAARLLTLKEDAQSWAEAERNAKSALSNSLNQLFIQSSDTAAQAEMQSFLQRISTARKVRVESQKFIPSEKEEVGSKLAIAMDLRGKLVDVLYLLDDISRAKKLLQIQRWSMRLEKDQTVFLQIVVAGLRVTGQEANNES